MQNLNLKIDFINKLMDDHYLGEFGINAPNYKRIRFIGHESIDHVSNGTHYQGESYTYLMDADGELIVFDIYLNKNNGQKGKWEYLPRLFLQDYFPNSKDDQKERIYNTLTLDIINFLGNNIEI